jgi:hypothetical protein
MVDFLGRDFPFGSKSQLSGQLNTSCVKNVVTTERGGLGRARPGTDAEDCFFPGTGHTYPHLDEIHDAQGAPVTESSREVPCLTGKTYKQIFLALSHHDSRLRSGHEDNDNKTNS